MAVLSGSKVAELGIVSPIEPSQIQPASVDVRLDGDFVRFLKTNDVIDPAEGGLHYTYHTNSDPYIIGPGELILASTYEIVRIPNNLVARFEGKALSIDTLIPTTTGIQYLKDVHIGDYVYGTDGKPKQVADETEVMYARACYEVVFSDGTKVTADASHQWLAEERSKRGFKDSIILTTEELLAKGIKTGSTYRWRVPAVGIVGQEQDLPVAPYTLGAWLGDGTSSSNTITLGDRDSAQIISRIKEEGVTVDYQGSKSGAGTYLLGRGAEDRRDSLGRYSSNGSLKNILNDSYILGNKHIPEEYFLAPVTRRLALLQGLMDTDGYINKRGDQAELAFSNKRLADDAKRLLQSLGFTVTQDVKYPKVNGKPASPSYRNRFRPDSTVVTVDFKLSRVKSAGSVKHSTSVGYRTIRSITKTESVPVKCLEVEGGMYLVTEAYIPTHNSSLGRIGIMTHVTAGFIDPGFEGQITIELCNVSPNTIILWPGMKIGQICVEEMADVGHVYGESIGSTYQGQRGPTPYKVSKNFTKGLPQ